MENIIEFSHPEDPLPFADGFGKDFDTEVFDHWIVKVSSDATVPVSMVNPSAQPVNIFRRTKLVDLCLLIMT